MERVNRTLLLLLSCAAGVFVWLFIHVVRQSDEEKNSPVPVKQENIQLGSSVLDHVGEEEWNVFNTGRSEKQNNLDPLHSRYRLAGTFFSYDDQQNNSQVAIVDDLRSKRQNLLRESDRLDEFKVLNILRDHVILEDQEGKKCTLQLSFANSGHPSAKAESASLQADQEAVLSENRFGKQIAENRWVLKRDALMNYYNELLDDPERIAAVYISLKPDYNDAHKIEGYDLDMIGENDFFEGVGLHQGDVIRKVNSMKMVSQARGEYFLKEFVNNRLNAVVIDIERDNVPKKMIYLLR